MTEPQSVLVIVKDLFFQTRLQGGLVHLGLRPRFIERADDLVAAAPGVALAIVDLAARQVDPIEAIRSARAARPDLPILAFGSHVNLDLRQRAIAAGASRVVANSAIATELGGIVGRLIGRPSGDPTADEEYA